MSSAKKMKMVMVICESLAGTGHKIVRIKPKGSEKLELVYKDPIVEQPVLYKELKKIRTLKSQ